MTSRPSLDTRPSLTEAEFQQQVTDLAEMLGYKWAHFRPAQTSKGWRTPVSGPLGAGWPDLVLVRERDRRLIFAEVKSESGRLSPEQDAVLDVLRCLPMFHPAMLPSVQVHLWRPRDLAHIAEVLR